MLAAIVLTLFLGALGVLLALFYGVDRPADAPPLVSEGLPIIGNLIGFASGPLDFIKRNFEAHGPIFSVKVFHKTLTFIIGPKVSAPFFQNLDDTFSQQDVYGFMTQVFGKDVVYDAPPAKRKAQMQNMSKGLRADRLKAYVPIIVEETEAYLAEHWGTDGECDILEALSELTILTSSRVLHGEDVRATLSAEVAELFHDLDKGITPLSFFWATAPTDGHRKRDAARKEMVRLFSKVIASRRKELESGSGPERIDILQVFVEMTYKDGSKPSDDEITGLLIALLFAGQHTSSITSCWTTLYLAEDAELMKRCVAEQEAIFGAGSQRDVVYDDLNKMELLHNSIKEVLRMQPPLIMLMRKAMKHVPIDAGSKQYTIPTGDIVITSPAVAGRLPDVFADPETFDPDRYAAPREEHKVPFAHLGFGGGIHQCMGQQFGYMQVKTIMSVLLRKYELKFAPGQKLPEPDFTAMVVGPKGKPMVQYALRR
ncbi:obtusifoliol 14-alpha demethylase [Pelagophyceae sp. CCMP2097]|nr:obtusifoliol 14-alpha demethylase [Pelagophyceae sp. CCMP2097]